MQEGTTPTSVQAKKHEEPVEWTASEFIAHHKGVSWYLILIVVTIVVAGSLYFFTRDRITTAVVLVSAIVFGVSGARKPRVLPYRLDDSGLTIGERHYPYSNYKSFAIVDEGSFASIFFTPFKRFMPGLSIYFAPEDEDRIVETLSSHMPMQPGRSSMFDSLMRRIRF